MGDIVVCSPIVRSLSLQKEFEVHCLTKKVYTSIWQNNIYVKKVYAIESELPNLSDYDIIIDLQKNLRSYWLTFGAKTTVYRYSKLNIRKWLLTSFKIDKLPEAHLVDRYFSALEKIGVTYDGQGLDYFIESSTAIDHLHLPKEYIVVNAGATYYTKRILDEHIKWIIQNSDVRVIVLGGKDVEDQKQYIEELGGINLIGKLSLDQSAMVMNQANRIITGDSGLMHIATALGKDVDVFWGNTTPKFGLYPLRKHQKQIIRNFENNDLKCRPCSKLGHNECPKGHFKCMKDQNLKGIL